MHATRTAAVDAAYLLPHLQPGWDLLDVGCGPGTITAGFSEIVAPGRVVGVDVAPEIVAAAATAFPEVHFEAAEAGDLPYPDGSFDVAHAHQVLQHLTDPVDALVEMRRVVRPDGLVAAREVDYGTMTWWPADPRLDRWLDLYHRVARGNGAEPDAGRRMVDWFAGAALGALEVTASAVVYADEPGRHFWGGGWAERVVASPFADQAVGRGHATAGELHDIAEAWRRWADTPNGTLSYTNIEVVARVPSG
ncbi:MAG: methyltransferase domain-containing protein [Acidimicrobiia bacterium]|nr:methyltransferase domain-containing protein [Acidimicrobiia bacterium]